MEPVMMDDSSPIKFFRSTKEGGLPDPNFVFSNFYRAPFESILKKGRHVIWQTVEHFFQANKFPEESEPFMAILNAKTPKEAAKIGRTPHELYNKNWDNVKEETMLVGLLAKFCNYSELYRYLIQTWPKNIIENSPKDSYWGCGSDGQGKNRLGILLVDLRNEITDNAKRMDYQEFCTNKYGIIFNMSRDEVALDFLEKTDGIESVYN